jgi:hypothetical protein
VPIPPEALVRDLSSMPDSEGEEARLLKRPPRDAEEETNQTARVVGQIPSDLWEPHAEEILHFLRDELQTAESERGEFVRKLARWKLAYRAPIADGPKNWPIWNSSNITVPVIKEIVNTLAAQIAQSTLTTRPRWVLKDLAAEWKPFVDPIERFLDIASERDMGLKKTAIPWLIEGVKFGTSMLEIGWDVDARRVYKYTPDGKDVYPSTAVFHDGPKPIHFPIQDFWIRFGETDIQGARWVARRIWMTEKELKDAEKAGKFFGINKLYGRDRRGKDEASRVDEVVERTRPGKRELWEVFKVWLDWDLDGDGRDETILLYFSRDALQFLSRRFNPNWHGRRPYVKFGYFPVEHRFYDEGLCEMLEDLQLGISDKHNKRADNETMSNAAMIITRRMAKGLLPGDPIYSGKIIQVADVWNDIREFRLSEPYPSTVQSEGILRQYAERLSGVGEAQSGSAMPVSRTTAAAQLALLQEQAKRVDLTVQAAREGLDEIGFYATNLYYQYGTNGKALEWLGEAGRIVEAVFRLPRRVAEIGHALRVATPTSLQNRQVKRENAVALFNLLVQMYERIMPFAQLLAPEQLPEVAHGMVRSAKTYMLNVLQSFEETDPEDVLAGLTVLEKVLPRPEDLGGMEHIRRAEESASLHDKLTRLEDLYREAEAARGGFEGVLGGGGNGGRVASRQGVPRRGPPGTGAGG